MGFLTPLYIAGFLAVSLPVAFHLIRRMPRGETPFSSLIFLTPSPPRLTRRSRLDNILLLILRGLALTLLALAFARPFLRRAAQEISEDSPQEKLAILLDASVSMRREDLWQQAVTEANRVLAESRPLDQLGVYVFDETLRAVASFEDLSQLTSSQRRTVVEERLSDWSPGWSATQLGRAILDAVDAAGQTNDASEQAGRSPRRIVVISDLQSGSHIETLGEYEWPDDVYVELVKIESKQSTNAGLQRLADESTADAMAQDVVGKLRVRVSNSADSQAEQFRLQWSSAANERLDNPVDVYVPAGESRVVRIAPPRAADDELRLQLNGDAHSFDNTVFYVPPKRQELTVLYLGDDQPDDAQASRYFLEAALSSDVSRNILLEAAPLEGPLAIDADQPPVLVAVTSPPSASTSRELRQYAEEGGAVLYAINEGDDGSSLAELLGIDSLEVAEADVNGYTMLQQIDFSHPMFAPMAGPRFNNFTQIRFWKHRILNASALSEARIVAQFEDDHPAILEQRVGAGRVIVFAAGWKPSDGQLSRSWKFLLMISSLVDDLRPQRDFREDFIVNEPAPLPAGVQLAAERSVTKPDGSTVLLPSDASSFTDADLPGVYAVATADGLARLAVNIDPTESDTAPLSVEQFEQLGCPLVGGQPTTEDLEAERQLRDVELERRQDIWKWLVAVVLVVLIAETWLAGRLSRQTLYEAAPG